MPSLRRFASVLVFALLVGVWMMPPAAGEATATESSVLAWHGEAPRAVIPEPPPLVRAPVSPGSAPAGANLDESLAAFRAALPRLHAGIAAVGDRRALAAPPSHLYDMYQVYRL